MISIETIDVKVFPNRLLSPVTVEKLLNKIYNLDSVVRVVIHGPSIPDKVYYGPAKGLEVDHSDRKTIKVRGKPVELKVKVGKIIITLPTKKVEESLKVLTEIVKETLPCKCQMFIGSFTKKDVTISDYIKYGLNFEDKIDKRLIGLADPNSRLKDAITNIK